MRAAVTAGRLAEQQLRWLARSLGYSDVEVRFAGIPLGHELTSLVLAILQVGGHPSTASPELLEQILARDALPHSATTLQREQQDPGVRLAASVERYIDALHVAAEEVIGGLEQRQGGLLVEAVGVHWFAEAHRDLLQPPQEPSPRHGLVCASDEHGHDRHRIVTQHHSHTRLERLKASCG
mgnify:CR=1 FL=1